MERPSIENPEDYVKKHLQKKEVKIERKDLSSDLSRATFEYSIDSSGTIEMEKNGLKLSFDYIPIEPPIDIDIDKLNEKIIGGEQITNEERHAGMIKAWDERAGSDGEFKEITRLNISNGFVKWDLKEEAPNSRLFVLFAKDGLHNGGVDFVTKNVYMIGLNSPKHFIALLHEVGHVITLDDVIPTYDQYKALLDLRLNDGQKLLKPDSYAVILDAERTAWAYAIRRIVPFVNNFGIKIQDIIQLKDYSLQSYKGSLGICITDGQIVLEK